jgi:hypothetical protein
VLEEIQKQIRAQRTKINQQPLSFLLRQKLFDYLLGSVI